MSRNVPQIEALLSARLFLAPQLWERRIYFISNMSGRFSLYAMDYGGSVPEPLLPPDIALQNPELMNGYSFHVSPKLGVILVGIDKDGDEKYQPMFIPIDGGFPELAFPDVPEIVDGRVGFAPSKDDDTIVYVLASAMAEQVNRSFRANLATRKVVKLGESKWGGWVAGANRDNTRIIMMDGYTVGDDVLYQWEEGFPEGERRLLHGIPLEQREEGQEVKPNALGATYFTPSGRGLLTTTGLFEDTYGVG